MRSNYEGEVMKIRELCKSHVYQGLLSYTVLTTKYGIDGGLIRGKVSKWCQDFCGIR